MAIALVQSGSGTGIDITSGTTGNITLTGVAAGNLLIVVVDDVDGNTVSFTVSDDKGNTWSSAVSNDNSGYSSAILYCLNAAAGTTVITITASGTTNFVAQAQEWSGGTWSLDTTSSIDESSTTSHVCSATSGDIDTTGADVVICNAVVNNGSSFGTRTAGSGYTAFSGTGASSGLRTMWQYQIFSGVQANEQGAYTTTNSKATAACIAAFKCTPGAAGLPLSLVMFCISVLTGCWWPCCYSMLCYYYYTYIGSFITYTNCGHCSGGVLAECWQITVTGIAAGNANCPNLNGTWIIDIFSRFGTGDSMECAVRGPTVTGPDTFSCVGSDTGRWKMGHTGTDWLLGYDSDGAGLDVSGIINESVFDCVGPNTFTMSAGGATCCTNYPATLTATPVPC